jgi:hypothetical protein
LEQKSFNALKGVALPFSGSDNSLFLLKHLNFGVFDGGVFAVNSQLCG